MRLRGFPEAHIEEMVRRPTSDREKVERVERVVADFDALDSRRKRAVNVRELVAGIREAIR